MHIGTRVGVPSGAAVPPLWTPADMSSVTVLDYFDATTDSVTLSGANVEDWAGELGVITMPKSGDAARPLWNATGGPNSGPVVHFNTSAKNLAPLGLLATGNDYTLAWGCNLLSGLTTNMALFDASDASGRIAYMTAATTQHGIFDGTFRQVGTVPAAGEQSLMCVLEDGGSPAQQWFRDNVSIGTGTYAGTRTMTSNATTRYGFATGPVATPVHSVWRFVIATGVISTADRALLHTWLMRA